MKHIAQIFALALLLTATLSHAENIDTPLELIQAISINDLKQSPDGTYTVVGDDPYWVYKLQSDNSSTDRLQLNITSIDFADGERVSLEVFFRAIDGEDEPVFDPNYRIKLQIEPAQLRAAGGSLSIPLRAPLKPSLWSLIRLDIERCEKCRIRLAGAPALQHGSSINEPAATAEIVRLYNGSHKVEDAPILSDPADWHSNDIERSAKGLRIAGDDPYLVSPLLDVDTATLGGVQFSLRAPADVQSADLQLFYATEQHRFIEAASSFVKIPNRGELQQFVIPLNFLASEAPAAQLLEQLRLDINNRSAGDWQLGEVRLIGHTEYSQLREQVPARILQRTLQRVSGWKLIKKAVRKVFADLGFSLSYLLLVVLVILGFRRAYKQ